jgi:hypothetical protein
MSLRATSLAISSASAMRMANSIRIIVAPEANSSRRRRLASGTARPRDFGARSQDPRTKAFRTSAYTGSVNCVVGLGALRLRNAVPDHRSVHEDGRWKSPTVGHERGFYEEE